MKFENNFYVFLVMTMTLTEFYEFFFYLDWNDNNIDEVRKITFMISLEVGLFFCVYIIGFMIVS